MWDYDNDCHVTVKKLKNFLEEKPRRRIQERTAIYKEEPMGIQNGLAEQTGLKIEDLLDSL